MSKNLSHLSGRKGLTDNLFERIGELAEKTGSPSKEDLAQLAEEFLIRPASLYGTASFYEFTRPENKGKKVYVCNGSSCLVAGTQDELKKSIGTHIDTTEIGEMCCLGRCHENGAFHYEGHNYSGKSAAQLAGIIEREIQDGTDTYTVEAMGAEILTTPFPAWEEVTAQLRNLLQTPRETILDSIRQSGLRGRGGAGFPIGIKMQTCLEAAGDLKFVVCNADEGDPGSFSDRYILEQRPEWLLIGMLIAGYTIGAQAGVVYVRAEYPASIQTIRKTIAILEAKNLAGQHILGSDFHFQFKLIEAKGAYVCGEETALLASIEGQRPEVRVRPPFPATEGLFGKPTLVNNVETLANLYYILTHGGDAFAKLGRGRSTGTKLVSLDSSFRRPGVYEVDMGTPLQDVVEKLGQGFSRPTKALHIGGPLGGLVPVHKIADLTLDFESFAQQGFLLGHASVVGVPEDYPMVAYLEHLFEFTAHESCGKCFPCRLGSVRGQELLHKAQHEDYTIDPELFHDLLTTMEKGSLCALGGGIPLPMRNALAYFQDELRAYFKENQPVSTPKKV
ncbi:MAG: NAD(P)H-dependent oxidoreductase subunit E [Saprospirales bacterium]|nr:NAD(P)H-dependent oxidoreductase subunit E [Saprospirales bacterium]